MTNDEFPGERIAGENETLPKSRWAEIWQNLSQAGLAETAFRLGTNVLLVALILLVAWGMREFYNRAQVANLPQPAALAADLPTPTPQEPHASVQIETTFVARTANAAQIRLVAHNAIEVRARRGERPELPRRSMHDENRLVAEPNDDTGILRDVFQGTDLDAADLHFRLQRRLEVSKQLDRSPMPPTPPVLPKDQLEEIALALLGRSHGVRCRHNAGVRQAETTGSRTGP